MICICACAHTALGAICAHACSLTCTGREWDLQREDRERQSEREREGGGERESVHAYAPSNLPTHLPLQSHPHPLHICIPYEQSTCRPHESARHQHRSPPPSGTRERTHTQGRGRDYREQARDTYSRDRAHGDRHRDPVRSHHSKRDPPPREPEPASDHKRRRVSPDRRACARTPHTHTLTCTRTNNRPFSLASTHMRTSTHMPMHSMPFPGLLLLKWPGAMSAPLTIMLTSTQIL